MSPRELARLREAVAFKRAELARRSPRLFIPHTPTPKQQRFLDLDCLEALYGGAAAGGKSDALLMAALQYVHVPGYAALLLRRTYADLSLPGAVMDRAHDWLQGSGAAWNDRDKRWTFPSGATLSFGYMETERDKYRYQGAELQFVGVDELTQWVEPAYTYLLSRLRRLQGAPVPLRARSASNPGGVGHDWVKKRFIDGTGSGAFVPASLADNPHVDADAYRESLARLDSVTRQQLLDGIWIRDSAGLVYLFDEARNQGTPPSGLTHYIVGIDYGFTDATAFAVVGWRPQDPRVYIVRAYKRTGMTPSKAAEEAHALSAEFRPVRMVGDIGGLGKGYVEEARARFTLPIEAAEKNNKRGYIDLLNGDLERGRVVVDPAECGALLAEWSELPWNEDRSKEASSFANHCADAALYAWRAACAYNEREPAPPLSANERAAKEEAEVEERAERELLERREEDWWQ